jgi:glutathione S-transferase
VVRVVLHVLGDTDLPGAIGSDREHLRVEVWGPVSAAESDHVARSPPCAETLGQNAPAGAVGDSTAIIRALEERYPQPPLYPTEPVERRRALELEDFFDEELGPYIRRLLFHDLHSDRAAAARLAAQVSPPPMKRFPRMSAEYFLAGTALRYGAGSAKAAERARRRVLRALDRLEAELGANDYLVGERFTVADLTAASLFYPLVLPAEGPVLPELPATFARFREPLKGRRGFRWVEDMFRRHRRGAPGAIAAPPAIAAPGS